MKNSIIIIISASILFSACGGKKAEQTAEAAAESTPVETMVSLTDAQLQNAGLTIGSASVKTMNQTVTVNGSMEAPPQNKATVSFPLGGYLKQTKLVKGMHVSKGEVLAVLEDPQYIKLQQEYLNAQTRVNLLQQDYNRQSELNQAKASSDKTVQSVYAELQTQNIAMKSLAQQLNMIGINPSGLNENNLSRTVNITAPISGYVSDIKVNVGKYISPTDVLFEIVSPDNLQLVLKVFEKDIPGLKIGQSVYAYTNNNPNKKIPGKIAFINKVVNEDRSIEVVCQLQNSDAALTAGQFMVADIEAQSSDLLTVPNDAVIRFENKHYIYIAKDAHSFEMTEVKLGYTDKDFSAVTPVAPLNLTQYNIVLKNAYTLLMKMKNTSEE